ncbi:MAG: MerC family mercury resistance protein [Gammaproteobacteria bacterium]
MVAIYGYSKAQIFDAVKAMYTAVATRPDGAYHFPVGRTACRLLGYPEDMLETLPEDAVASFAGVGFPFRAGVIRAGDVVLDIGAGSGTDTLIASHLAGPHGKVFALDMTPAMREKLRSSVARLRLRNVEILDGTAEHIPLPDHSVDVITSNGVLNLVPDKRQAIAEMFRVLKPSGRVQIADIVIARPVTPDCHGDPALWAECVVGATIDDDYLTLFRDAGFLEVKVLRDFDYFAHSRSQETRSVASRFGARSIEITMRRGASAPHKLVQLAQRGDPRRLARSIGRRGLWGMAALVLALIACYGTLMAVSLLPLVGLTWAVDEQLWAGAIILFAGMAAVAVAAGARKHRSFMPLLLAVVGAGLIACTMLGFYHRAAELLGFALMAGAVFWDLRLRHAEGEPARATRAER